MPPSPEIRSRYTISSDPGKLDVEAVHKYLSEESYWARGVKREVVQRSLNGSLAFGVYEGERQVGLARVITDRATFAYLCDVYILPEHRGQGLSKWLMECVMLHPDLQGLRKWMLGTLDAHGLYKQYGFKPLEHPERIMEIKLYKLQEQAEESE